MENVRSYIDLLQKRCTAFDGELISLKFSKCMVNFLLSLLQVFIHSQFVMGNKLAHITLSVFYVMLWMSKDVTAGQQCKAVESSVRGKALKNHAFKSVTVGHPVECNAVCEKDPRCQSYNFFTPRKLCELNDRRKETSPQDFVSDEMRFYMGIWRPGDKS